MVSIVLQCAKEHSIQKKDEKGHIFAYKRNAFMSSRQVKPVHSPSLSISLLPVIRYSRVLQMSIVKNKPSKCFILGIV